MRFGIKNPCYGTEKTPIIVSYGGLEGLINRPNHIEVLRKLFVPMGFNVDFSLYKLKKAA